MASLHELKARGSRVHTLEEYAGATGQMARIRLPHALNKMEQGRQYAKGALQILVHLAEANQRRLPSHPLLEAREIERIGIICITTDGGLAGKFVENSTNAAIAVSEKHDTPSLWWIVGNKGASAIRKHVANSSRESEIVSIFDTRTGDVQSIAHSLVDEITGAYISRDVDAVYIQYTNFINSLTQQPRVRLILPLDPFTPKIQNIFEFDELIQSPERAARVPYTIEPSHEGILEEILPRFMNSVVTQAMAESRASELSYRAVTAQNASKRAGEVGEEIKQEINKARQTRITADMLDISNGVEALSHITPRPGVVFEADPDSDI